VDSVVCTSALVRRCWTAVFNHHVRPCVCPYPFLSYETGKKDLIMSLFSETSNVPKLLFTRTEAAFSLGISKRSLDHLIKNEQLAVRKLGRKVCVPFEALLKFSKSDHASLTA